MEPFRYHIFICSQQKPEGIPSCPARGSGKVIDALRAEIARQGLADEVQVTTCGSLGLCERGPNLVVYPEGIWYSGLTPEDVPELVRVQLREGRVLERLVNRDAVALREEIRSNREKMLAGMRARDAAGVLPDELAQIIRGFQESRALLTAIELDAFTAIGEGADAAAVAARAGIQARSAEMLLNALAAMGILSKENGAFHNTPLAARYFVAGSADDARAGLMHTVHLWPRWSTLTDCVRAGTSVTPRESEERSDTWTQAFIAAMHRNARERAGLVVQTVGTAGVRRMLDVGGGSGAYSIAFAQASASLRAEIFDLATVTPIAQSHIEQAGLAGHVTTRAGDLRSDKLGAGYDLILISAICHMLSPEENRDLLRRCYAALAEHGRVVIQDFILEPDKTAPRFAALFALNMLVGTRGGSSYSHTEYTAWLREAGLADVRHVRLPGPTGLMIGTREA